MQLLLLIIVFSGLAWFQAASGGETKPATQASTNKPAKPSSSDEGKKIFVARCAKCHDDDMNKKLPDGSTLLARLAASKDPRARLGTRIKDTAERDAVAEYFQQLLAPAQR
jgi:mono/diheme cytochrome c family protein